MDYLIQFIAISSVHFLALVSPGPDFALIARNSFVYSKKTGIFSALGLALGIVVHISYSLLGIGLIISRSIVLFSTIKIVGALYLIYIGVRSFRPGSGLTAGGGEKAGKEMDNVSAVKMGFLTNILNPKVTLFFLSLFTQFIDPGTPFLVEMVYAGEMVIMTFVWFSFVAIMLSKKEIKERFSSMRSGIEKVFGTVLILLGIKIALSSTNK